MYLGRYIQGQEAVITALCRSADGTPGEPDALPVLTVYDSAGGKLLSAFVPVRDRSRAPGLFTYRLPLGGSYPVGRYLWAFQFVLGGAWRRLAGQFDVVAGGAAAGAVIAQHHLERPHANYLVQRTDGGKRYFQRGPYL